MAAEDGKVAQCFVTSREGLRTFNDLACLAGVDNAPDAFFAHSERYLGVKLGQSSDGTDLMMWLPLTVEANGMAELAGVSAPLYVIDESEAGSSPKAMIAVRPEQHGHGVPVEAARIQPVSEWERMRDLAQRHVDQQRNEGAAPGSDQA